MSEKAQFLREMKAAQRELEERLSVLSDAQVVERPAPDAWSLRETLHHLTYWEQYMLNIVRRAVEAGEVPQWVTDEEETTLNAQILTEANERPPRDVVEEFHRSTQEVQALVESLADDVLTDPDYFDWLKGQPLLTYIANESIREHREEHLHRVL